MFWKDKREVKQLLKTEIANLFKQAEVAIDTDDSPELLIRAGMTALAGIRAHIEAQAGEIERLQIRFAAPVVCMCGSTRFKQAWISENARLTGEGNIVLAVGLWGHHERVFPDAETKARLDALHKRKIDLCDWVWVLDMGGYIGESTRSEIEYAESHGKPVRYLSREIPDYVEPIDPLAADLATIRSALSEALGVEGEAVELARLAGKVIPELAKRPNASCQYTFAKCEKCGKTIGSDECTNARIKAAIDAAEGGE